MNILIGIIILIVALSFILVYANTHPPKYPLHIPPSEFKADYEDVSFISADGIVLKGWLVKPSHPGTKSPAIIICHGVGANRSDFTELAVSLAQRGHFVLLFDFRAHGESSGRRTSLGYHEQKDIIAALEFLKTRHEIAPGRIGIYGFSLGGSSAILAAAKTGAFSAIVADSAFTSLRDQAKDAITGFYHLPSFPFLQLAVLGYELYFQTRVDSIAPVKVIATIAPKPVLIIAGEGDRLIPADNGKKLFAAAGEPKELWIIPVSDHGGTLAAAGSEYEEKVGGFFDRNLK
ncbi:MAG: alpha/beta fold hydrolase [Nitrospirae bacterium]|nr:alpha/beta fold hydrolase [Nitrospirota bacterium]